MKPILFTLLGFLGVLVISCTKDPDPPNKVPVANAGASQVVVLYADSTTLTGSGTDEDGQVVAYLWSQVSGPAPSIIVNPGSSTTKVREFVEGTYVFQLMVTDDKGATGLDTMMVTVGPAAQVTFTAQPANNPNEVVVFVDNGVSGEGSNRFDLPIEAWTNNNNVYTVRGIIKFDLSSIPANANIVSANLFLSSYPSPTLNGNFTDANFGTNNIMLVQQVTSDWSPSTLTWFNQPSITTNAQVIVPQASASIQDLNLDVKEIVESMVANNANFGFYLRLQTETYYNSRILVGSSNTTYSAKIPKLVVVYQ